MDLVVGWLSHGWLLVVDALHYSSTVTPTIEPDVEFHYLTMTCTAYESHTIPTMSMVRLSAGEWSICKQLIRWHSAALLRYWQSGTASYA